MTGVDTSLNAAPETIADVLDDWRIHLRARNRRPETIKSYLSVARDFCGYLAAKGMPTQPAACSA